jgi:glycosyltransferase involved in cell wall biosynthesis
LRGALEAQARELGIADRVTFAGVLADVRPALHAAGFAVSASKIEGMSNALLEQMSCGLGAVMPRVGGCEEALTGHLAEVPAGITLSDGRHERLGSRDARHV